MQPGGAGRAQSQRSAKPARPRTRATGAWAVGAAGPEVYPILPMRNTRIIEEIHEQWARDNGYRKVQASSDKPEDLHAENTNRFGKVQASSFKRQALSKDFWIKIQSTEGQGPWPLDNSSWIMDPWTSFKALGPRVLSRINVLSGCDLWNEIWCGENLTLFPLATFNSTVKKCLEVLYPNRSGIPSKLRFSIRFQ